MLSKFVASMAMRRMAPRAMVTMPQRMFLDRLGLEGQVTELTADGKGGEVSLW